MLLTLSVSMVFSLCVAVPLTPLRYRGHQILQILPHTAEDIQKIVELATDLNLDMWKIPKTLNNTVDVRVSPELADKFISRVEALGLKINVWIKDIQRLLDEEQKEMHRHRRATSTFSLATYHRATEISNFLDYVASVSPHTTVHSMGHSYEGRDMKYVKISNGNAIKAIYLDGGIHAREWIASSTMVFLINQLAMNPNNDPAVNTLLNKFDFYILPLVNPDGYEYSHDHERLWRKNRRPAPSSSHGMYSNGCDGVDLNRNFGYHWNPSVGGSTNPCNEIFSGQSAMSEPEVVNVARFMDSHSNIIAYLNVHSYGQYWIYPWGYTPNLSSDFRDLDHVGRVASNAIYQRHQARFTVGQDTRVLYAAAGGADDYAKGHAGIKYSYTVELRDTGRYGFILPPNYIVPVGEEIWEGLKAFASEIVSMENL